MAMPEEPKPPKPVLLYPFLSVYRLAAPPPQMKIQLLVVNAAKLLLFPGPFQVERAVPVHHYGDRVVEMTMGTELVSFPQGAFLVMQQEVNRSVGGGEQMEARLRSSEIVALLDMDFRGLVAEKLFEGAVTSPGHFIWAPEGPVRLTARPSVTPEQLTSALSDGVAALDSLPPPNRERLRLMSRWYRRAQETLNQIDKFLFLYIAIEVFPATGRDNVPNAVRDFLAQHVFPDIEPSAIKERLMLGPITGLRADIVHDGKSSITASEQAEFPERLVRLEAVTRESMGLLAGRPYGGTLDKWVRV